MSISDFAVFNGRALGRAVEGALTRLLRLAKELGPQACVRVVLLHELLLDSLYRVPVQLVILLLVELDEVLVRQVGDIDGLGLRRRQVVLLDVQLHRVLVQLPLELSGLPHPLLVVVGPALPGVRLRDVPPEGGALLEALVAKGALVVQLFVGETLTLVQRARMVPTTALLRALLLALSDRLFGLFGDHAVSVALLGGGQGGAVL